MQAELSKQRGVHRMDCVTSCEGGRLKRLRWIIMSVITCHLTSITWEGGERVSV